ncbi:MAG: response regulator [Clostridiales bacterium]|jgi:YesN/AraC family two-component response regulator|nr:response regulator [Clostridiales bacterium]
MYKLLIIDDEPVILRGMTKILDWSALGCEEILLAGGIKEAREQVLLKKPALCICDVRLGEDKGYDLIRSLRGLGFSPHFIMISGYSDFEYAREALRAGALDYLVKPIETDKLRDVVEKIVREKIGDVFVGAKPESQLDPVLSVHLCELSPLIAKIIMIVYEEYSRDLNLKILADRFRMNSTYLGQLFLQETRTRFSDYLTAFRMNKARQLIETTDDKMAVIIKQAGYKNTGYFYTQFYQHFGFSPGKLRS